MRELTIESFGLVSFWLMFFSAAMWGLEEGVGVLDVWTFFALFAGLLAMVLVLLFVRQLFQVRTCIARRGWLYGFSSALAQSVIVSVVLVLVYALLKEPLESERIVAFFAICLLAAVWMRALDE